jgi:hypothetical protein
VEPRFRDRPVAFDRSSAAVVFFPDPAILTASASSAAMGMPILSPARCALSSAIL